MADISLNKVKASDQVSPTTPAIDSNVTQGQESQRRSSTCTLMSEVPQRPLPPQNGIITSLNKPSGSANKLSSGTWGTPFQMLQAPEHHEISFLPAQRYYSPSVISKLRISEVDEVQYSKFYEWFMMEYGGDHADNN